MLKETRLRRKANTYQTSVIKEQSDRCRCLIGKPSYGKFSEMYTQSFTRVQRKYLIRLLISEITFSEIWKIDTTKIQLNKDIIRYFLTKEREKSSSSDDFSLSFTIEL